MNKINLGGLALAMLTGVLGAASATLTAGHTSGPAISGAILAGAATGAAAFFVPTTKTGTTGAAQIAQGVGVAAGVATAVLPQQVQQAAVPAVQEVSGALAVQPASANINGGAVSAEDLANLAQLIAGLATQAAATKAAGSAPPAAT